MATNQDKVKNLSTYESSEIGRGENGSNLSTKGKYTARERIAMLLDEDSFRRIRYVRQPHRCNNFGMEKTKFSETELLPDKERSTDVSYLYLHRILPYSEEHFQKCWLRRSASHGQSDDGRSSDHRTERFRWCTYSGRRKFIGRIC